MNTFEKVVVFVLAVAIAVVFAILIVFGVAAEDNEIGFCTNPKAVNYIGADIIQLYQDEGYRVVNDGSCYYLKCVEAVPGDADFAGVYSCDEGTEDDQNFWDWANELLPGMAYGPAYYGKLIDVGGCTDPVALNWMDPQWWPDYNIIEDGSCVYPENAL